MEFIKHPGSGGCVVWTVKVRRALAEITFGQWGEGPRWQATLRFIHSYQEGATRWFESREACEDWAEAVDAAPDADFWQVVRGVGGVDNG